MNKILYVYLIILAGGVVIGMIKAIVKEVKLRRERKVAAEQEAVADEENE